MKKGIFCISLDTELMWGRHAYKTYRNFLPRIAKERNIINQLLFLFQKYDIGITWAIVGHLFLDQCHKINNRKHPEIIAPENMLDKRDWFEHDPSSDIKRDPLWYGLDMVKLLQKYPQHEIASHSFSHILFDDSHCLPTCAESDIKACISLAKKNNIKLDSFVFPVNSVGYLKLLKKYQFICFRGLQKHWYDNMGTVSKFFATIDLFLNSPSGSIPKNQEGLINIPGSMYFVSGRGMRRYIPKGVRFRKAKKGIEKAIQEKKVFHLWTHPTDFADQQEKLFDDFNRILEYAVQKRKESLLEIKTMRQIAQETLRLKQ